MKRFFNNAFFKVYKVFLILAGLFFCFVYSVLFSVNIDKLIFTDDSIAAVKFTLGNLIFIPVALFLAYLSILLIMYIINAIRNRAFIKPDKTLVIKHIGLLLAVLVATFMAMQFNTVLYADGRIVSNNFIEKFSPEYTAEDYETVTFYGETEGSMSPNRPYRTYFQFYMIFFVDEDTYIEFHPAEFRDHKTIYDLGKTIGDNFQVWPENGLSANVIATMDESDYELYKMMYKGIMPSEGFYEEETEQEYYSFDGNEDFKEDYNDEEYTIFPEEFSIPKF